MRHRPFLTRVVTSLMHAVTHGRRGQPWHRVSGGRADELGRAAVTPYLRQEGPGREFYRAKGPEKETQPAEMVEEPAPV